MATEAPLLRPLSVAEILDSTFTLYRRNFKELVSIAAIVQIPLGLVQAALMYFFYSSMSAAGQNTAAFAGAIGGMLLIVLISMLGAMIVYAALAVAISHHYLGEPISVSGAFNHVLPRLGTLLLTWFVIVLLAGIGYMLCVIPGIYLYVLFLFAWPVVVLEGRGVGDALSRSVFLVGGNWWRVFGTMLLLGLITLVFYFAVEVIIALAVGAPAQFLQASGLVRFGPLGQAISQLVGAVVGVLTVPAVTGALVILYYDLRVRREGFDLQLLFSEIAPKVGMSGASLPPMPGEAKAEMPDVGYVPQGLSYDLPPPPATATAPPPPTVEDVLFPDRAELPPPPTQDALPPPAASDDSTGLPPPPQ